MITASTQTKNRHVYPHQLQRRLVRLAHTAATAPPIMNQALILPAAYGSPELTSDTAKIRATATAVMPVVRRTGLVLPEFTRRIRALLDRCHAICSSAASRERHRRLRPHLGAGAGRQRNTLHRGTMVRKAFSGAVKAGSHVPIVRAVRLPTPRDSLPFYTAAIGHTSPAAAPAFTNRHRTPKTDHRRERGG